MAAVQEQHARPEHTIIIVEFEGIGGLRPIPFSGQQPSGEPAEKAPHSAEVDKDGVCKLCVERILVAALLFVAYLVAARLSAALNEIGKGE